MVATSLKANPRYDPIQKRNDEQDHQLLQLDPRAEIEHHSDSRTDTTETVETVNFSRCLYQRRGKPWRCTPDRAQGRRTNRKGSRVLISPRSSAILSACGSVCLLWETDAGNGGTAHEIGVPATGITTTSVM